MTEFQKFMKHVNACANLTFEQFCEKATLSESAARDLLTTHGGRKYLFERLEEIRADSLTIGDVVEMLHSKGEAVVVNTDVMVIGSPDDFYAVEINCGYDDLQEVLFQVVTDYE